MRLLIIAVGHKMPDWVSTACHEYSKRMPPDCAIELKEIKPDASPAKEAVKIRAAIPKNAGVITLDEHGKDINTKELANQLKQWRDTGKDIVFLIGGADGLDATLKSNDIPLWRLSSLTLPHAFARLLLIEQLYRAWTILQGHPYHRE
ncbi:MAG: 23S rRNA (pseudouridine(1915)-N(3))-methyltransferase RlmH [Polynucleobacter sp.]|jgi:23S rRNA (pseudouridine1915-N3)-methyltransferase